MSDVLDLDALIPPSVTIKLDGAEIVIKPPKTGDLLKLGFLGQKLQISDPKNEFDSDKTVDEITEIIRRSIPELANKEINTMQLLKLMQIISEMATPPDAAELEKRGLTVDGPKEQ